MRTKDMEQSDAKVEAALHALLDLPDDFDIDLLFDPQARRRLPYTLPGWIIRPVSQEEKQQFALDYCRGASATVIANRYWRDRRTVVRWLKAPGIYLSVREKDPTVIARWHWRRAGFLKRESRTRSRS